MLFHATTLTNKIFIIMISLLQCNHVSHGNTNVHVVDIDITLHVHYITCTLHYVDITLHVHVDICDALVMNTDQVIGTSLKFIDTPLNPRVTCR